MILLYILSTYSLVIISCATGEKINSSIPNYHPLNPEKTKELLEYFNEETGWVQVGEKKWFLPYTYVNQASEYINFEAKPADTWILSYPRTGTTLTQELVWLIANNLDFKTAKSKLLIERFPFLELSMLHGPEENKKISNLKNEESQQQVCKKILKPSYEVIKSLQSPRFIKSHFPFNLLPHLLGSGAKIVYVARNPRDVVVSNFKFQSEVLAHYKGNFTQFWNIFRNDFLLWSPYWEHVKEAWSYRNHENVLFLFYEEMLTNMTQVIERVSNFFGKTYTNEQIDKLKDHLNITNFRNNPMVNGRDLEDCGISPKNSRFIRKGNNGDWKNYFTEDLKIEADEWINKNLADTDLKFPT